MDGLKFLSLSSGSSGNCYFLGNTDEGILIDAGISARKINKTLKEHGIELGIIKGLCISHDHSDHIIAAGYIGERCGIPVYATRETIGGMNRNFRMPEKIYTSHRFIVKGAPFKIGNFEITAFDVMHDGSDNSGFVIRHGDICIAFATDIGCLTPEVKRLLKKADYIVLESNYDDNMLKTGRYPEFLKRRIAGNNGHLCNSDAAEFIAEAFEEGVSKAFLCHISAENNSPDIAFDCVCKSLAKRGFNEERFADVIPLARTKASPVFILK